MSDNIQRSKGRSSSYKFDRGGVPAEFGPFIGTVKNNVDPIRSGRLQVYIEQFAGDDPEDNSLWRTVMYVPPFYGVTPKNNLSGSGGDGSYKGNQQSYGMWFTPPDIGTQVICFFVAGDPNQGYYIGCVPDPGVTHMIPAIGASRRFKAKNSQQQSEIDAANAKQMPVVEINSDNTALYENPRFFDQPKPVHDYVYAILYNQGLLGDYIRGPISSSAQRESPSAVFGMSTPGRAIYQGGLSEKDIKQRLEAGSITPQEVRVEGRRGGHSIVLDDGDLRGRDNLIRIRTAKGHQITMSDEADCFYFIHANGQIWFEMGSEGTFDVYGTNSINIRTQGEINLHADKTININATENLNIRAGNINVESQNTTKFFSTKDFTLYSKAQLGLLSDAAILAQSATGGWKTSGGLKFKGSRIDLNTGAPPGVEAPKPLQEYKLDDVKFESGKGWQVQPAKLETIVPRAPTHEPYPYHNKGVPVEIELSAPAATPASPAVSSALAQGNNLPVPAPVDAATVLKTPVAPAAIGSLDKAQVTGLLAQAKTQVSQAADQVSVDKGIGAFGFKPDQLESSGYLKPGTLAQLQNIDPGVPTAADITEAARLAAQGVAASPESVAKSRKINEYLASPTVWSGKDGVSALGGLLSNANLQESVQFNLMNTSLTGLKNSGVLTGTEAPSQLGALVQSATKFGVGAVDSFVKGVSADPLAIASTIKSAQFATDFVDKAAGAFAGFAKGAVAVSNTVNRAQLDAGVVSALGDPKIPAPEFKPAVREEEQPSELEPQREEFNALFTAALAFMDETKAELDEIFSELVVLEQQQPVNQGELEAINGRYQAIRTRFNSTWKSTYAQPLTAQRDAAPEELKEEFAAQVNAVARLVNLLAGLSASIRDFIASLRTVTT